MANRRNAGVVFVGKPVVFGHGQLVAGVWAVDRGLAADFGKCRGGGLGFGYCRGETEIRIRARGFS